MSRYDDWKLRTPEDDEERWRPSDELRNYYDRRTEQYEQLERAYSQLYADIARASLRYLAEPRSK